MFKNVLTGITKKGSKVIITILEDQYGKYVGKAKCDPDDNYVVEDGEKISLLRAKIKMNTRASSDIRGEIKKAQKVISQWELVAEAKTAKAKSLEDELNKFLSR